MRAVTVFDTAVSSTNLGDEVIMDASLAELRDLFSDSFIYRVASHDWMGAKSRGLVQKSDAAITCGTNLLSSRMWFKPLWKLRPTDAFRKLSVTLLGAGWYQHQGNPDFYTRWLLKNVLSKNTLHSVRDNYSKTMLEKAGISNVVNTACPTLWNLTPERCAALPKDKAKHVVTTLNTYFKNAEADKKLLQMLADNYDSVYYWVQTETDYLYAKSLDVPLTILQPSLHAFDNLLRSDVSLDYIGNRLHAGIRAMQSGRRSFIIEVDNRALEMGADFKLPTVQRDAFDQLEHMIGSSYTTEIDLPTENIQRWRDQFRQQHQPL